jgi:small-conductance mechanosensitive channel
MDQLAETFRGDLQALVAFGPRMIAAVLVLIAFYYLGKYFGKLVIAVVRRASVREIHEAFIRAGGGVTAVVLGFAFREIGENFLAGTFLAFSRPFKIGDLIRSEDIEGYVKEIELRYTHLRTEDGKDVYVPSSQLFARPVINYTQDGLRRISFSVGIDYSNDSAAACALLQSTLRQVPGVLAKPAPSVYILALAPQYVELEAFFWIDVFESSGRILAIQTEALDRCRQALLEESYVVSADTTANIALSGRCPPQ